MRRRPINDLLPHRNYLGCPFLRLFHENDDTVMYSGYDRVNLDLQSRHGTARETARESKPPLTMVLPRSEYKK